MKRKSTRQPLSVLLSLILLLSLMSAAWTGPATVPVAIAQGEQLAHFSGSLAPGETLAPIYQHFGSQNREINLKMAVTTVPGDGWIELHATDDTGATAFSGTVLDGEALWASAIVTPGINTFTLHNPSSVELHYDLWLYGVSTPSFSLDGTSRGDGVWQSHVSLEFPASGLYQFDFEAATGRYQFFLGQDHIQKTVEDAGTVAFYVEAGVHNLRLVQDSHALQTNWSLDISGPDGTEDTLPYTKAGGDLGGAGNDFEEEWLPVKLKTPTMANFQLTLAGDSSDAMDVFIYAPDGSRLSSVTDVYGGETLWWTAGLPATVSRIQLIANNANSLPLTYDLAIYQQPTLSTSPTSWTGTSLGPANNSSLRFHVPSPGLFDFSFDASPGRFQFLVGSNPFIRKSVETAGSGRYFLPAGTHYLTITQDSTLNATSWSLAVAATDQPYDTLPYSQSSGGELGGTGNDFQEEWFPLSLETSTMANFQLTLAGDSSDAMDVFIYAPDDSLLSSVADVYGGETLWWTADLPAAVSRIQLVANPANSLPLTYDLGIYQQPNLSTSPTSWTGTSFGPANNSSLRFHVPSPGLFDFSFDASPGRFQFLVSSDPHILKSVEASGSVRYFLPAGTHYLTITQDSLLSTTSWSLAIAATGQPYDTLPYSQSGGNLGGADNPFLEEWVPAFLEEAQQANFRLELSGDIEDGLQVYLYHDGSSTPSYVSPVIYGQEIFWWTADLASGLNQMRLVAQADNANPLAYALSAVSIPTVVYDDALIWDGLSKNEGGNSEIELEVPVPGIYHVAVDIPTGFANVFITGTNTLDLAGPEQSSYEFNVPLEEGGHLFQVWQDSTYITTTWTITVSMWDAAAPELTGVDPMTMTNDLTDALTIWGSNFQPGAQVQLDELAVGPTVRYGSGMLQTQVPAGLIPGVYTVTVTNPDGQSAVLPDALWIVEPVYFTYLPQVFRGAP